MALKKKKQNPPPPPSPKTTTKRKKRKEKKNPWVLDNQTKVSCLLASQPSLSYWHERHSKSIALSKEGRGMLHPMIESRLNIKEDILLLEKT